MRFRQLILGVLGVWVMSSAASGQGVVPDSIPDTVVRRIRQGIWPHELFDAAGQPEGRLDTRRAGPALEDLRITRQLHVHPSLPGVELYVGEATPPRCFHCRTWRASVARRDTDEISLLAVGDLGLVASWSGVGFGDSTELRSQVVALVAATRFLGPGADWIRPGDKDPDIWRWFISTEDPDGSWQRPRTYSHVSTSGLYMEFGIQSATGIFACRVSQTPSLAVTVSCEDVAQFMFN